MASPRLTLRYPEEYDHIFLRVLLFSSITNCFLPTKAKKWKRKDYGRRNGIEKLLLIELGVIFL